MVAIFHSWGMTRRGNRQENQDRFSLAGLEPNESEGVFVREGRILESGLAFLVADGVGGREGGRWAAECAANYLGGATYSPNSPSTVEKMIATASNSIRANAPNGWRPATTAAGIVLSLGAVLVFGIGDSRVYGLDRAGTTQLTVDHRSRTDSRAITRFLGGERAQSIPDICELSNAAWLGFLICTDGFYARLTAIELGMFREVDPKIALINLMDVAVQRGSADNLTAVYVSIG
jgi:serine/threonine protein phosphatase PrpC